MGVAHETSDSKVVYLNPSQVASETRDYKRGRVVYKMADGTRHLRDMTDLEKWIGHFDHPQRTGAYRDWIAVGG